MPQIKGFKMINLSNFLICGKKICAVNTIFVDMLGVDALYCVSTILYRQNTELHFTSHFSHFTKIKKNISTLNAL